MIGKKALKAIKEFIATYNEEGQWVFSHEDGTRLGSVRKGFDGVCRRSGLIDFHPHDLRHNCAAWLVQAGVTIREVSELLRHSDIRVTLRYAHLSPDNVRAAVKALEISHDSVALTNHSSTKT